MLYSRSLRGSYLEWSSTIAANAPVPYRVVMKDLPVAVRPRERLLHHGPEALSDAELLAIIMRTGSQHQNALETANSLLADHDGLEGLSRASVPDLCKQIGLGQAKAAELRAVFEISNRLQQLRPGERPQVRSPDDIFRLMIGKLNRLEQEHLMVVLLSTRNRVIKDEEVCRGGLNLAAVRVGEIFKEPVRQNAAAVVLVHNHPSGDPTPSPDDVRLTVAAKQAGDLLDIELLDHLVIGGNDYVSLRERGLGFPASSPRL